MGTCTYKRPIGHNAHVRKLFENLQTHMIITMLTKRRKTSLFIKFWWELNGSSFEQTWFPFTKGCTVAGLVENVPVVLEEKIFKFCECIFARLVLSLLGKGWHPLFVHVQTLIPFTQGCIVPSLVEIVPVVLEEEMKCKKFMTTMLPMPTTTTRQTMDKFWS